VRVAPVKTLRQRPERALSGFSLQRHDTQSIRRARGI
jgi:hypothetical protein